MNLPDETLREWLAIEANYRRLIVAHGLRCKDAIDDIIIRERDMEIVALARNHFRPLAEEVLRLREELKASVEHHERYRDAIDKALGEPRASGEWILYDHLGAINKLRERVLELEAKLKPVVFHDVEEFYKEQS